MIQDITLMIGAYIVTRMLQTVIKRESASYVIVQIFAVCTILFTLFIMAMTFTRSADLANLLK
jgi:uncharacterized membrane protein